MALQMQMEQVEFYRAKSSESLEIINVCQNRIDNYKMEIKELTNKFEVSQDHLVKLNTEMEVKDSLLLKLNSECEHLKMELGEARNRTLLLTNENNELTENIKDMTETIIEKDLKLEATLQEFEECKSSNEKLTTRVVTLMEDLLNKEAQCENLTQDVELKNLTMAQVSEEYEKMKKIYKEECRRVEELNRDNKKYIGESWFLTIWCRSSKANGTKQSYILTNLINSQQEEIAELKQMKDGRFEEEKEIYQIKLQNKFCTPTEFGGVHSGTRNFPSKQE
uniref:Filamin A-interacting protein 1-like protein n=1 Tax=Lygus hesperus TaxID=30085 RepID=A0A0A9XU69_LYGHE